MWLKEKRGKQKTDFLVKDFPNGFFVLKKNLNIVWTRRAARKSIFQTLLRLTIFLRNCLLILNYANSSRVKSTGTSFDKFKTPSDVCNAN
jgi:hypothetical protein